MYCTRDAQSHYMGVEKGYMVLNKIFLYESLRRTLILCGTLILSNTYANHDQWEDADKVQDEMRRMGLKKLVAYTRIEVDQNISTLQDFNEKEIKETNRFKPFFCRVISKI